MKNEVACLMNDEECFVIIIFYCIFNGFFHRRNREQWKGRSNPAQCDHVSDRLGRCSGSCRFFCHAHFVIETKERFSYNVDERWFGGMTIHDECVTLWDDGTKKLYAVAVPYGAFGSQYHYTEDLPCITIGFVYKDLLFQGFDYFTFFDRSCTELVKSIENTCQFLNGSFRLYDMGADTDGYIEFVSHHGALSIRGQLGSSYESFSLQFEFNADQTLLSTLLRCLREGI